MKRIHDLSLIKKKKRLNKSIDYIMNSLKFKKRKKKFTKSDNLVRLGLAS